MTIRAVKRNERGRSRNHEIREIKKGRLYKKFGYCKKVGFCFKEYVKAAPGSEQRSPSTNMFSNRMLGKTQKDKTKKQEKGGGTLHR